MNRPLNAEAIARECGKAKRSGDGWLCCCPAHADKNPSLSISNIDGRLLFYCHAGCGFKEVLYALKTKGLIDMRDNYNPSHTPPKVAKVAKVNKHLKYARKIWEESSYA